MTDLKLLPPPEPDVPAEKFDRQIVALFVKGFKWKEIAELTGRSVPYIKKLVKSDAFQDELREYVEDIKKEVTAVMVEEVVTADQLRKEALQELRLQLRSGMPAAKVASAKVILDEAARERGRQEERVPISLDEVRRMSKEDARKIIQDMQARRG